MSTYTVCVHTTPTEQEITLEQEHVLLAVLEGLEHLKIATLEHVTGITVNECQAERHTSEE